jgi:hypothetical protein
VTRTASQAAENQQVEGAGEEIGRLAGRSHRKTMGVCRRRRKESTPIVFRWKRPPDTRRRPIAGIITRDRTLG